MRPITEMAWQSKTYIILALKKRHSSKQVNILISKTILFIPQNILQSIPNSSLVAKNIKTANILNSHVF